MMGNIEKPFWGQQEFKDLSRDFCFSALDIGARGGANLDLLPIAPLVDLIGFEPDAVECERLNQSHSNLGFRSEQHLCYALGPLGEHTLNLFRWEGFASLLEPNAEIFRTFQRSDYIETRGSISLKTVPLDTITEMKVSAPRFMKIDVQGFELEVFKSGVDVLNELVAIRAEVSFLPIYKDQPLLHDITAYLSGFGFIPARFIELHHWRRDTKIRHPRLKPTGIPYAHGQLSHGDVLFIKSPTDLDANQLKALGLIALCYEMADLALECLGNDWSGVIEKVSTLQARQHQKRHIGEEVLLLGKSLADSMGRKL